MIINIEEDLFLQVKEIVKNQNLVIYEQLEKLQPIQNSLQTARTVKTQRVKQSIKETIKSLCDEDITPTRYQVNKRTGIAYVTLNKYYDDILKEVQNGKKI